jgi:hypothetical protein
VLAISGSNEDNAATGDLDIRSNIEIVVRGTGQAIVWGTSESDISRNTARTGGGIASSDSGYVSISNSWVRYNNGSWGGGIYIMSKNMGGMSVKITNSELCGNSAIKHWRSDLLVS